MPCTTSRRCCPSPDVRTETAPGGHLGVLTGRSAARSTWSFLDEFLADYDKRAAVSGSGPAPPRPARAVSV
jgi:polyhydroxyalkanoate synthase